MSFYRFIFRNTDVHLRALTTALLTRKFMYPLVKQKKIKIVTLPGVKGDAEDGESGEDEEEDEDEVLQDSEPGPLSKDPKDVEEVLNVISQSIYREGQGKLENQHTIWLSNLNFPLSRIS